MNPRARKWINVAVAVVAAAAVFWVVRPKPPDTAAGRSSSLTSVVNAAAPLTPGSPAPDFQLKTVSGKTVSLAALKGHPVMLNFWATWCPWCKKEIPDMIRLEHQYGNQIQIYGVDVQEPSATVKSWMSSHGVDYPVLLDNGAQVAANYGVTALPVTVFIHPNGTISQIHVGAFASMQAMLPFVKAAQTSTGAVQ